MPVKEVPFNSPAIQTLNERWRPTYQLDVINHCPLRVFSRLVAAEFSQPV